MFKMISACFNEIKIINSCFFRRKTYIIIFKYDFFYYIYMLIYLCDTFKDRKNTKVGK